jgi:hypothetical protein
MTTHKRTALTAMTLLVSVGSIVLTAGSATALSYRGVDGTSGIQTNPDTERAAPAGFGTAGGRVTNR